jgi:type IV pilus assembly protein PilB
MGNLPSSGNIPAAKTNASSSASSSPGTANEIAQVLIRENCLTEEQLAYAVRVQSKLASPKTLLNVILELGFTTAAQLKEAFVKNRLSIRIGELLVELGYIRREQLEAALSMQKEATEKKKLGEVLVDGRFISEQKLVDVLSYQLGFPRVEPSFAEIDRELLSRAPSNAYSTHFFLPVRREEEGGVVVAFADPLDRQARNCAEDYFGTNVVSAICTKHTIQEVLGILDRGYHALEQRSPDEGTIIGVVESLIEEALSVGTSDIHIEPMKDRLRVRYRTDGVLLHHKDLPIELAPAITSRLKILAKADITERRRHQGGKIAYEDRRDGTLLDLRASFYVTVWGEKTVLRILNRKATLLELDQVGMYPLMMERFRMDALDVPSGVIIITGPTGSGKTTTLYCCVNYLNNIHTSILTAEDPVEYVIDGISQCSIDSKISLTFEESLRHMVRQDPDVIVVGEIRDRFSAETSIQAALTGHKVLTTFHTEDSIGGLIRLLNMDIEAFLISSTVVSVVAQRLLRKVCANCGEDYTPTPAELNRLGYSPRDVADCRFRAGRGCSACNFTGYKGRVGVFEILVLNEMVRDAILGRKTSYEIRRISVETSGLITLLEDGIMKAADGSTSLQEVFRHLPRVGKPRSIPELRRLLGVQG